MRLKPVAWTSLALLLGFGSIFGVIESRDYLKRQYLAGFRPPPVTVTAQLVREEIWDRALPAVGTLKAAQGIDIATETAGILEQILFEPGATVSSEQELFRLDDRVDQAALSSLQARRRLAEINFERDRRLLDSRAISRTDFDKTEAQLKDVSAQVERLRALIDRKHIRAPFAGRIGIPLVKSGQYLDEGEAVVTLQALDVLEVDFSLPEQYLPQLAVGQSVRCRVQAYADQSFGGSVVAIDAKVDRSTRNVLVRAHVPNTTLSLLPGMFVNIEVVVDESLPVLTVPETAISYNLYGDSVFVVNESADAGDAAGLVVERRYVTTGEQRGPRVAVREGLRAGERVVDAGTLKLDHGAAVVIDNSVRLTR